MLRSLWKPAINDLAVASICTNVETDEYEDIEFVVGQVLINDSGRVPRIVLRRLRLTEDQMEEEIAPEAGEDHDALMEARAGDEGDEYDEDFDCLYIEPEEFFNLEDCLPLLSIGQLIDYIRKSKFGQRGYKLMIPRKKASSLSRACSAWRTAMGKSMRTRSYAIFCGIFLRPMF